MLRVNPHPQGSLGRGIPLVSNRAKLMMVVWGWQDGGLGLCCPPCPRQTKFGRSCLWGCFFPGAQTEEKYQRLAILTSAECSYLLFVMMPLVQMCLPWELPGPCSSSWTSQQCLALWVSSQDCGHRHWSNLDLTTCMTCQCDEQLPVYNIFLCIWMVLNQALDKLKEWWAYPCL